MFDCSIIIINYNTFSLTVDCIRSIQDKVSRQCPYEIILVDNASTECDAQQFLELFPRITLVKNGINLGFAKANNIGIQNSNSEYILLLNSDTVLLNDAVTLGLSALKADKTIGVLSGQLQFPNGEIQPVAGVFPDILRELKELFRVSRFYKDDQRVRYYLGDLWDYSKAGEADWLWGAFLMFRKEDLQKFPGGKLHDNFFMYYEDVQWCYHFKKVLKKKVYYTPEPKVIHYLGGSDKATTNYNVKYFEKILPNEYQWLRLTKGVIYTRIYYLIKSLYYFSLRRRDDIVRGKIFLKFVFP